MTYDALFVQHGKTDVIKLKFYRVSNNRGDRRFSIETIKRKMESGEINEGDLLYISIFKQTDGTPVISILLTIFQPKMIYSMPLVWMPLPICSIESNLAYMKLFMVVSLIIQKDTVQ